MNNENVNKEVVPEETKNENNELKIEEDSKKKKKSKEKPAKKKVVPFDQIDITTATEDDIIQSGLKHHTKSDYVCYMIMGVIVVLAILPMALRMIIPRPITEIEKEIVYYDLTCYRTISREGYQLSSKVAIHYRDGAVDNAELTFTPLKVKDDAPDDYIFAEINELNNVNEKGLSSSVEENSHIFKVNFKENSALINNDVLKDYSYFSGPEAEYLKGIGYSCDSKSETKKELVKVDTNEFVKSLD